ncbi:MAG: AAA family ATPase, partial [Janthinobacterium lividum]
MRAALKEHVGGGTYIHPAALFALLEERGLAFKGEQVALISGVIDNRVWVTNTAQLRIEEKLAELAKQAAQDKSSALSVLALARAIEQSGLDFEREPEHGAAQKAAIYALGTGGRLSFVTGVAGAGKSTLLKPLVSAYQNDTTYSPEGREVVGVATAWRQADAVKDAGIRRTYAMQPLLDAIDSGDFQPTANTVLVLEEVSQIAPRPMLRLLELQAETGMTIKALGDREQCQSIEAGDTIALLRKVLPEEAMPEILTTVRQKSGRSRLIASLFRGNDNDRDLTVSQKQEKRLQDVKQAVAMKREDGTIRLVGGDQDQVTGQIADLYMQRRDVLRASGSKLGVTVSALTNQDAAEISAAIRDRMKARGELGDDEVIHPAVARRGNDSEQFDLPLATGDKVRLFRKTAARIDGRAGFIGANGDVVEILAKSEQGLTLRNRHGEVGEVEWRRLKDAQSDRLLLGFGHVLTIDSAQGITSDEHINALPRGTAGLTAFKNYVAESRHTGQAWTMISEIAVFEAARNKLAMGDRRPISTQDLYDHVAED